MGIPPVPEISWRAARDALHLSQDSFLVTAFGQVEPHKRITIALDAFAAFLKHHPDALAHFGWQSRARL